MTTRLEKIQEMLSSEPHDPFLRYSLAMEQAKMGDFETSQLGFRSLMEDNPPYVPAYFMAAQQCVTQDLVTRAREFLRDGIEAARLQGNLHAAGEMSELLSELGERGE